MEVWDAVPGPSKVTASTAQSSGYLDVGDEIEIRPPNRSRSEAAQTVSQTDGLPQDGAASFRRMLGRPGNELGANRGRG